MSTQEQAFDAAVREELRRLHTRISPRFRRPEVRERARRYLAALLGPVDRRTARQIAEHTGEKTDDGVQRLLNKARWDAAAIRDDLRDYVLEHLGDASGVLVLTEIGFPKKGPKSAGVERLRNSTTGRLENRQLGLFLTYTSQRGWACIDRALYLPQEWAEDEARHREAGVPEGVSFATKGEQARAMLGRAFEANVPAAWVTGGEAYGADGRLRGWLEARGRLYVLREGHSSELSWPQGTSLPTIPGWFGFADVSEAKGLDEQDRGPPPQERSIGLTNFLIVGRAEGTGWLTYHRAYGPRSMLLPGMARVVSKRRNIEEGLERAKGEVGLDQYEVRRWDAWHRHITLSLLAHASLQVTRAHADGD